MELHIIIYGGICIKRNIEKHSLMLLNDAMQLELNEHLKHNFFFFFSFYLSLFYDWDFMKLITHDR